MTTETKLALTFSTGQFFIRGFSKPYRLERNKNGGGFVIYIRKDLPSSNKLENNIPRDIEGMFPEFNLRKN